MKRFFVPLLIIGVGQPGLFGQPPAHAHWKLTFSDEFEGNTLDTGKWEVESGSPPDSPAYIRSSRSAENVRVKDGVCRLVTRREPHGTKNWTTAHLHTRVFRQKYGYFEARYRYGAAPGLNNAFWLLTRDVSGAAVSGQSGGASARPKFEIDINEGHYPSQLNMNVHQWVGKHWSDAQDWTAPSDLAKDFHVYGLEWNQRQLTWYFDGKVIQQRKNDICHSEVAVIFSTAVLKWAGEITDALDGASMDIDYVRVYQYGDGPGGG